MSRRCKTACELLVLVESPRSETLLAERSSATGLTMMLSFVSVMRLLVAYVLILGVACEEPLRLPYIEPILHNWPEPYRGVSGTRLHVFHTGSITVSSRVVYRDGSLPRQHTLDSLVFGIEHPRRGLVLVGTGLNRGLAEDAPRYLGPVRSVFGQADMQPGQDILSQLTTARLSAEKVKFVILPDLRLGHSGELESLSQAAAVVTREEHAAALSGSRLGLYMADEFDQVASWQFVDFPPAAPLGTFAGSHDLFGDGSIELIDVAGATAGGLAVLVRLPDQPVFLCGNLAWTYSQARYAWEPGLTFQREWWWEKIWRLKKFKDLVPALLVLPDHDWDTVRKVEAADIIVHEFSPPEEDEKNTSPAPDFSGPSGPARLGEAWKSPSSVMVR